MLHQVPAQDLVRRNDWWFAFASPPVITKGRETMYEYDWDSELNIHRNRKLHDAEQWRWAKATKAANVRVAGSRMLGLATAAASRTAAAGRQAVSAAQAWVAGSSEPREECC